VVVHDGHPVLVRMVIKEWPGRAIRRGL
jgi:hypothetical protein